jgi:hypothetical protein
MIKNSKDTKKQIVYISKLDATKRQLDFAIKLFFHDGDIVVRHTIIAAAHGILNDILKKRDEKGLVFSWETIRKDKIKEVTVKMKEAQNFFKHADRSGEELKTLEFNPSLTDFFIFDACEMYKKLSREQVPLHFLYDIWFSSKYPNLLEDAGCKKKLEDLSFAWKLSVENRMTYFNLLPELEKSHMKYE